MQIYYLLCIVCIHLLVTIRPCLGQTFVHKICRDAAFRFLTFAFVTNQGETCESVCLAKVRAWKAEIGPGFFAFRKRPVIEDDMPGRHTWLDDCMAQGHYCLRLHTSAMLSLAKMTDPRSMAHYDEILRLSPPFLATSVSCFCESTLRLFKIYNQDVETHRTKTLLKCSLDDICTRLTSKTRPQWQCRGARVLQDDLGCKANCFIDRSPCRCNPPYSRSPITACEPVAWPGEPLCPALEEQTGAERQPALQSQHSLTTDSRSDRMQIDESLFSIRRIFGDLDDIERLRMEVAFGPGPTGGPSATAAGEVQRQARARSPQGRASGHVSIDQPGIPIPQIASAAPIAAPVAHIPPGTQAFARHTQSNPFSATDSGTALRQAERLGKRPASATVASLDMDQLFQRAQQHQEGGSSRSVAWTNQQGPEYGRPATRRRIHSQVNPGIDSDLASIPRAQEAGQLQEQNEISIEHLQPFEHTPPGNSPLATAAGQMPDPASHATVSAASLQAQETLLWPPWDYDNWQQQFFDPFY